MDIAKSIRVSLAASRKNQTWLAKELGVTKSYVSGLCSGAIGVSTDRLEQLAGVFGLKVSEFIKWGEM